MRVVAVVMAVMLLLSSMIWAAQPVFVGALRSSGVVMTNSIPAPDEGTVRSGDSIRTEAESMAVITSPSYGRLEVRPDSQVRLSGDRVRLDSGAVAASRMAIEVSGYTIRPQQATRSWFAVANRDGRLVVAAHSGNVIIAHAGAPPVLLTEGSLAQQEGQESQSTPGSQADQTQQKQQRSKKAKPAAVGGWSIGSLSHAASVALVVGAGAAVAGVAAGAAVALSGESPSPSR